MSSHTAADRQHTDTQDPHAGAHTNPHAPAGPGEPEDSGPRRSWAVLAVALTAQILVVLDISVVNTALPSIGRPLTLDSGRLQWLVTAYLMMSCGGLLLGGRIADLMPRRTVFLTGLTVFTIASLVSGFATNGTELIAARAAQGVAAALLTPSALSLVMTTYAGEQRKKGLALWGAVGSLGVAVGVLVGGFITTAASWHFIFWINGPIGVVALLVGTRVVPRSTTSRARITQFDLPGAVTIIGSLATLIYSLGASGTHGWSSPQALVSGIISMVLFAAFLALERRAAAPLFPPHIWQLNTLVSGTTVMLGVTGLLVGSVFLTSIFVQTVLGFSALEAGVAFLPFSFAISVGTLVARHLLPHVSPRAIATARAHRRRRRRRGPVHRVRRLQLRHRHPARARRPRPRRRDGLRPGLGHLHDRHPGQPLRSRLRFPHDGPRDRRRPRCRGPLRGRDQRRMPATRAAASAGMHMTH